MSIELINRVCELASEVGKAQMLIDHKDKYIEQLEEAHKVNEGRIEEQAQIINTGKIANQKLQMQVTDLKRDIQGLHAQVGHPAIDG